MDNDLGSFTTTLGLIDLVPMMEPTLKEDPTYLWGSKRIDFMFISQGLKDAVVNAGHHPFHQHFVTDHKAVYGYFLADAFFDTGEVDKCHMSQRGLNLCRRDSVEKYITALEDLYDQHKILSRLNIIAYKLNMLS